MHSDELEEVMTRFVNGEADVLLSTTIIESGLDIPNANTIIIDRADRFGLSISINCAAGLAVTSTRPMRICCCRATGTSSPMSTSA